MTLSDQERGSRYLFTSIQSVLHMVVRVLLQVFWSSLGELFFRKPYMYSVPLTIVLCPAHRLHASVEVSSRFTTIDCSGCASIVLRGIVPPRTPSREMGFMERIGSIIARTKANTPRRYNLNGTMEGDCTTAGAAIEGCDSSSSTTDSQSLSSSFGCSPKMLFRLRNRTVRAGLRCLDVVAIGAGLLSSLMVSSSTNPTSVKIDRRRPSAACGRTCSML